MTRFDRLHATALLVALAGPLLVSPTWAQQPPTPQMPGMPMHTMPMPAAPSTTAFKAADDKMMKAMDRPMTGNADQDFVAGMLPHHGGAVDMAKVELQYGKDPELLRLAREIIAAQEKEIALMQDWQKKHASHKE